MRKELLMGKMHSSHWFTLNDCIADVHICPLKLFSRDLLATVKKLQDENRKLASSLAAAHEQSRDSAFSEDGEIWFSVLLFEPFSQSSFYFRSIF